MIKLNSAQIDRLFSYMEWEDEDIFDNPQEAKQWEWIVTIPFEIEGGYTSCEEYFPYSIGYRKEGKYYEQDCITLKLFKTLMKNMEV